MRIAVLGAGAIGRLFGVYLSRAGHQVSLVDPVAEVVEAINERGIGFLPEGASNQDEVTMVEAHAVLDAAEIRKVDFSLLAVKSQDTLAAVQGAAHLISEKHPIITLQTGLGNVEIMERVVPARAIIGGFTFMAATALGATMIRQGGAGKTYLGEIQGGMSSRVREIASLFSGAGLPATPVHRIMGRLWCKVIVYSAINALSAVLRVTNGELIRSVESITLMKQMVDEGQAVARSHSVDLVFHDLYGLLFDACRKTENNISSMLQDILGGQVTEIDAQCGALVRYGRKAGVPTPTQETMLHLVGAAQRHAMQEREGEVAYE
jgi:2-dehydropantoate 2-reductase